MDEKTEELRDIFLSVSDEETVTESQTDERGSLTDEGGSVEDRLQDVIDQLREKHGFETDLDDESRRELVQLFYDDRSDEELAAALDVGEETAVRARLELHLLREDEPDVDEDALDRLREDDAEPEAVAAETGLDVATIERAAAVVAARERSRRASHRFRTAFEEVLTDADLMDQFAADAHDDGLDDATEGAEVDVEF
jgi:hypothetical protein